MQSRFLGRTGVRVSSLALGTMGFGTDADESTATAIFARARAAGISLFDCADVASHPTVTAPILGARDVAQLEAGLAAADISIDAELYADIAALSPTPPPATDRNEEASATNDGAR